MNGSERSLAGQVALVTGATSGIGLQTALALTAQGVKVVGTGRNQERLGLLDQKIDLALTMDVTDEKSVQVVQAAIEDRYGRIDILVNNAGIGCFLNWDESSADDLARILSVNLVGAVRVANHFLPMMVAQGSGTMVSVASIAGLRAYGKHSAYCASKFGLVGWSKSVRKDLRGTGVSVCVVCPPAVDTPFFATAGRPEIREENRKNGMVTPEEVAETVVKVVADQTPEVVISGRAKLLYALDRIAPSFVDRLQQLKDRRSAT